MSTPEKITIADRVREETRELGLKPPRQVVFISHRRITYSPDDRRGNAPVRRLFSGHAKMDNLASEIIKTELKAMFPGSRTEWVEADFTTARTLRIREICNGADLILISPATFDSPTAAEIVKTYGDRIPVVVGGPFVTRNRRLFEEMSDGRALLVRDRVESLMPQVLKLIDQRQHQGAVLKKQEPFVGFRDYHQLRRDGAVSSPTHNPGGVPIEFGVGCDEKCRFCAITRFDQSDRDPQHIIHELKRLVELGIRYVFIVDDNLSRRSPELLREVFTFINQHHLAWMGEGSAEILEDEELARLVGKNNVSFLHGAEDLIGDVSITHNQKARTPQRVLSDLAKLQECGFMVGASLVLGLDDHRYPETFTRLAELMRDGQLSVPLVIHLACPYPGTTVYKQLAESGRITDFDLSHYSMGHLVYEPKQMSREELWQGIGWLKREIGDPRIIARVIRDSIQREGATKFREFPRALLALLIYTSDPFFSGLGTFLDPTLEQSSKSIVNELWKYLPPRAREIIASAL